MVFLRIGKEPIKGEMMAGKSEGRKQVVCQVTQASAQRSHAEKSAASRKSVETQRRHEMERKGQN